MKLSDRILILCFCAIAVLITPACKKEDSPVTTDPTTVSISNVSASPMQIVQLKSNNAQFTQDTYSGTLGSDAVTLARSDDRTLSFIVPFNSVTGTWELKASLPSGQVSFTLNIQAATTKVLPENVTEYYNAAMDEVQKQTLLMDSMVQAGWITSEESIRFKAVKDSLAAHMQMFRDATPEVQQYACAYMAANHHVYENLKKALDKYSSLGMGKKEGYFSLMGDMAAEILPPLIITGVALVAAPAGVITAAGYAGSVAAGAYIGWNFEKDLIAVQLLKAKNLLTQANNKTEIPEEVEMSGPADYQNDVETQVNVTVTYRTPQAADAGSAVPVLSGYAKNYRMIQSEWRVLDNTRYGSIQEFLDKKAKEGPRKKECLRIKVLDNANVSVTVITSSSGNQKVRFRTSMKEWQTFSYEIVYDDPVLGLKSIVRTGRVKWTPSERILLLCRANGWKLISHTINGTEYSSDVDRIVFTHRKDREGDYTMYLNDGKEPIQEVWKLNPEESQLSFWSFVRDIVELSPNKLRVRFELGGDYYIDTFEPL